MQSALLLPGALKAGVKKHPTLLVVSDWQDVNIGDIAHTPGLLQVLETFMPETKIILWEKSGANEQVNKMLHHNFPKVAIVYGDVGYRALIF